MEHLQEHGRVAANGAAQARRRREVAIIGGGMAGIITAVRLVRQSSRPLHIRIFDARLDLGRGLAYSTPLVAHKLNGPTKAFSLRPDDPNHFSKWLDRAARDGGWKDFDDDGVDVYAQDGRIFAADHVVLAPGVSPVAAGVRASRGLKQGGRYFDGPWHRDALTQRPDVKDILLIGSSLTMVDAVVALEAAGYNGRYLVVSRRGHIPEARREVEPWPDFLPSAPETPVGADGGGWTARGLFVQLRDELRRAKTQGQDWQRLVPAVRPRLETLWSNASLDERRRFLRHVRPYWDLFLHRLPPASAEVVEAVKASGRLNILSGTVTAVDTSEAGGLSVEVRKRSDSTSVTIATDAVISCAGIEYRWHPNADSVLTRNLFAKGIIRSGNLGIGIDADHSTLAVIDRNGRPLQRISTLGASLRSVFFESGTIGELVKQAALLAPRLERDQ
jgi:uncharacterized NAD(P)/FAD-binding protein YdhS